MVELDELGLLEMSELFQCFADRVPQFFAFRFRQAARGTFGVDPRVKQRFIGINVPDPRDKRLIQEDRFDHPALPREAVCEPFRGETLRKRFNAQPGQDGFRIVSHPHTAEFAHVIENQAHAIRKMKYQPVMRLQFTGIRFAAQVAAHAQMDQDPPLFSAEPDVFRPPVSRQKMRAAEKLSALFRGTFKNKGFGIKTLDRADLSSEYRITGHPARTK